MIILNAANIFIKNIWNSKEQNVKVQRTRGNCVQSSTDYTLTFFLRFSGLEFSVKLWLSGLGCIECWQLSNVLANIAAAIFRVHVY
jgi:hypothetical protein